MMAVARGDLAAMSPIYENRHRKLFRFFFRITGRQTASEDLVHEVFLRMIRYRHTYEPKTGIHSDASNASDAFESWMYRIARNALADQTRKLRLEDSAGERELDEMPASHPTPFDAAARQQDLALLYRALRALPDEKRELLVLARFEGLSYQQIGRIAGCEAGAVKVRVFRAMKELCAIYADLGKEKAS